LTLPSVPLAAPASSSGLAGVPLREQTRARYPDETGFIERDGVRVFWERYGDGEQTVLLLPTWSVVPARFWKAQVPYLARHFRVLTFDGRGNGRSDRPVGTDAYRTDQFAADAIAVMDANAVDRVTLVSFSCGALWATILAADHSERVTGSVFISPAVALAPQHPEREGVPLDEPLDTDEGWAKYNTHFWSRDYRAFLEFFFAKCFSEPHSTKQIEDCVAWGLDTTPDALADATRGVAAGGREPFFERIGRVRCPTLVIHGDQDLVRPHAQGQALARTTGGELVTLHGSGHCPVARDPVKINLLIREFVERRL
jgi:pimeloyl-ACP methyl ester carboxylesterase